MTESEIDHRRRDQSRRIAFKRESAGSVSQYELDTCQRSDTPSSGEGFLESRKGLGTFLKTIDHATSEHL